MAGFGKRIPDEILISILSRLPATIIMKFRCVCKFWCSLTYDPYFIDQNLAYATRYHSHQLFMLKKTNLYRIDETWQLHRISPKDRYVVIDVSSSCNGLILLYTEDSIWLYNLTTKAHMALPKPNNRLDNRTTEVQQFYEIVYQESSKKYKVYRWFFYWDYESKNFNSGCQVLTVGSESWRKIEIENCNFQILSQSSVFLNNAVHWLAHTGTGSPKFILSFDIGDEKFRTIRFPHQQGSFMRLNKLDGMICVPEIISSNPECINLWLLKDYRGHIWSKTHSINFGVMGKFLERSCWFPVPINDKLLLMTFDEKLGKRLAYYDLKKETFTEIYCSYDTKNRELGEIYYRADGVWFGPSTSRWFGTYIESLVHLEGMKVF